MSPEMRIIAGTFKGRKIASCSGGYRPTASIVKKCLFDILGDEIRGARFLDLFAGAGAVGLEALSRGAGSCCFVENDQSRVAVLKKNLAMLEIDRTSTDIIARDYALALGQLRSQEKTFDIIYADPPYEGMVPARILGNIVTSRVLAEDGLLIYEAGRHETKGLLENIPMELYPLKERCHGGTALVFFKWRENEIT